MMSPEKILECWKKVFPNSTATQNSAVSWIGVRFHLVKDKSECASGYLENDPLMYTAIFEPDGSFHESRLSMLVTPAKGSYNVYDSVKLRKMTIKNVDPDKLIKRFQRVRLWVEAELPNLKNPMFDITTK